MEFSEFYVTTLLEYISAYFIIPLQIFWLIFFDGTGIRKIFTKKCNNRRLLILYICTEDARRNIYFP